MTFNNRTFFTCVLFTFLLLCSDAFAQDAKLPESESQQSEAPSAETETKADDKASDKADEKAADNPNEKPDEKSEENSTDKNADANELPFRYLNQYFTYEIDLPQNILLNDRSYNMDDIKVSRQEDRLKLSLGESLSKNIKSGRIEFLSSDKRKLSDRDVELTGSKLEIDTEFPEGLAYVCLVADSKYSVVRMCKPIDSKNDTAKTVEESLKKVSADDADLGDSGQIVLQDSKLRSNLNIEFKNGDWFYFETERRKVYPSTINKAADSLQMNIRFVDLDDQTVAYDDVILVGQRFFEIKLDPLISIRQDIVFNGADIRKVAISKTLIDRAKVTVLTKNRLTVTPIISYQQFIGDNANLSFKLRSSAGFGLGANYKKNFSPYWDWHIGGSFVSTKIVYDESTKTLTGKDQSLMELYGGVYHRLSSKWDLQGSVGVKTDIFVKPINTDEGLEALSGMNKFLEGVAIWNAYEDKIFEVAIPISLRFMLPGSAGGVEAKFGTGFNVGANGMLKMDWGRILFGFKYGSRMQNFDDFNFKEDYYQMHGGIIYLF
jgi:hypothetical protein